MLQASQLTLHPAALILYAPRVYTAIDDSIQKDRLGYTGYVRTVATRRLAFAITFRVSLQPTCELVLCTGQTPNIDHLQRIVYEQLVSNASWDSDAPKDIKRQRLDEAFRGQDVLLVLDDLCECGQPGIACVLLH